jgi:putative membrane protein
MSHRLIDLIMYEWVLALHIISVISWMAGLLYLPRLFVYHVDVVPGSAFSETLKIMEQRLFWVIMTPAMASSWIFGVWLVFISVSFSDGWFYCKAVLVLLMSVVHASMARWLKDFEHDHNTHSAKYFRITNEIPTLLMIAIVVLVVVKPF